MRLARKTDKLSKIDYIFLYFLLVANKLINKENCFGTGTVIM